MDRIKKGSFTIEATVIITMFLFLIVAVIQMALDFNKEIKAQREQDSLKDWKGIESFYRYTVLEEVWENESGDSL